MTEKPATILLNERIFHQSSSRRTSSSALPAVRSNILPLKYIDVTRTTHTNLDVLQESRLEDYWNIDVDRNLSDSWTGFTKFTILNEKLLKDCCNPGGG